MGLFDLVIIALFVGGFMLLSQLLKRAVNRARRQEELQRAQQAAPLPEDASRDATWGSGPQADPWQGATTAELERRLEPIAPGFAPPRPRHASNALFRSRRDLRHAVVVMTVLGPCRALESPGGHRPEPSAGGVVPGAS
jgi:hypothetical protein